MEKQGYYKISALVLCSLICFGCPKSHKTTILIAASSNLQGTLEKIVLAFPQGDQVQLVFGASGNLCAQIQQGAPFHIFLSADKDYPQKLYQNDMALTAPRVYGRGSLVLWTRKKEGLDLSLGLSILLDPQIQKVALPNPITAPYGKRAREVLMRAGLWTRVKPKAVWGNNVSQTAQFVQSAHSQIGIFPLSIALRTSLQKMGTLWKIPNSSLDQSYILLKRSKNNSLVKKFITFFRGTQAAGILNRAGYQSPPLAK